jgi:hypothetical protein
MRPAGVGILFLLVATAVATVEGTAGGVKWTTGASWKLAAPRQMRVATYEVPAAPGSEPGECGVFYFGKGQGGSIEDNFDRWIKQFEGAAPAKKAEKTVHELRVHTIDVSGTYLASGGPMMQSQGKKPGYRLLGAIVEAPRGLVFFKVHRSLGDDREGAGGLRRPPGSLAKAPAMKL